MPETNNQIVRVLVVNTHESEYLMTRYFSEKFRDNCYKLEWINNYQDALKAIKLCRYDVYLVDFQLDEFSGLDLLREATKAGCIAPIILLNEKNDNHLDNEAMQAGAADFLVKGEFEAPLLERAIRYSLKHARSLKEIQNSEAKFRSVIQSASDAIFLIDQEGKVTLWNKAAQTIFGYDENEILNSSITSLMGTKYAQKASLFGLKPTLENLLAPMSGKTINAFGRRKDGSEFPLELSGSVWKTTEGNYYTAIIRDITERQAAEDRLLHEATHDSLTGLPNRTKFKEILEKSIVTLEKNVEKQFAVLFLDLDRFKVINDSLGHVIGDKLLVSIGERLKNCVRPHDTVSRFGGDEFTILLSQIADSSIVTEIAERLQRELSVPFKIDGFEVFTSASIGIILSEDNSGNSESFLRDADSAMYRAKEGGKARYEIFNTAMHARNVKLLQMENDLRKAVERNEFIIHYQPILDLQTNKIVEFEALLRWQHPTRGLIPPNDFIPVAEETGLILPIGDWVLREACKQTREWQNVFPTLENLCVSVNLSIKQLAHENLTKFVQQVLEETNLNPKCLKLEVTETMLMENSDLALKILSELCALGVLVSTDDFGTGYSSLSYLHRFPFERLKIDRSFVGRMDTDPKSEEIVRTIMKLSENLRLEVVAEGVETERQHEQLKNLGCQLAQGFLFSKPVQADIVEQLLEKQAHANLISTNSVSISEFQTEESNAFQVFNVQ